MNAMPVRKLICRAVGAAVLVAAAHAHAANVDWSGGRYVYATNGSSVADALSVFAAGQHLPLRISGAVAGVVSGRFAMPPQQFLDTLCNTYGLVWYYDGAVLQVSTAGEQQRIAIRPNFITPDALLAALDRARVTDTHFPPEVDRTARVLRVHGPASYVEHVRDAAQRFEGDARARTRTTVRVIRLAIATAADQTRAFDGRTLTVPGAATLLRRRFERRAGNSPDAAAPGADAPGADAPGADAQPDPIVEFDAPLPVIEADAVTNSILIRDKPERIDGDGMLAADLDVRPAVVSVQTWVVDIDPRALAGLQPMLPAQMTAADAAAQPVFATVAGGGHALLAQLDALEAARHARLEIARTALTLDRSAAVIDRHEARVAQRVGDGSGHAADEAGYTNDANNANDMSDTAPDLWMSVQPAVSGAAPAAPIGLRIELGRGEGARQHRVVETSVAPGDCLAIAAPLSDDPQAPRRLVLLIPRIAG
ncbi:hypothetical protein PBS_30850 [Paraburkholderia sp. 2C]